MSETLGEELAHRSPRNGLERLAQNFRNMGTVDEVDEAPGENQLAVVSSESGIGFGNLHEKGFSINVLDTQKGVKDGQILHVIEHVADENDDELVADHGDGFDDYDYVDEDTAEVCIRALRADLKYDNLCAAEQDARDLLDALTPDEYDD